MNVGERSVVSLVLLPRRGLEILIWRDGGAVCGKVGESADRISESLGCWWDFICERQLGHGLSG